MKTEKQKSKNIFILTLAFIFFISITPIRVHASENDVSKIITQILDFLADKPLSIDLFINYFGDGKNVTYWEEEVYDHIKNSIIQNADYQTKLQDVLKSAYQNGHYKINFISDDTIPNYCEPSFDETRYNQTFAFNDGDLYYAIHGINGHLVIDATYLGDNQFEVWVAVADYYDFELNYECYLENGLICSAANAAAVSKYVGLGKEFYVTIGFTYLYTWDRNDSSSSSYISDTYNPSENIIEVSDQYYSRGIYDIGFYTGEWKDGKPNGYGTLVYDNDTKYTITMSNGDIYPATQYIGNWSEGKKYGTGIFTFANGIQYDGVWNVDGYYLKGYIISSSCKQYIEQISNGDQIKTVRSDDPIYNDSTVYKSEQNLQSDSTIISVEEGEFICEYTIKKIPVYESATSSNIKYYIINNSRNDIYTIICNKKYIFQDGTVRYSKNAGNDIEFLGEPD